MQRRVVQDVILSPKKSIRNIPIPGSRVREHESNVPKEREAVKNVREEFGRRENKSKKFKWFSIVGGIVIVLIIIFFGANAFAHATVSATLESESDQVNNSFTTHAQNTASSTKGITDSVISLVKNDSLSLTATTTEDVEAKASGTIVIFNNYSTAPQKLVANTRFANSDGLIYRITQSVVVPGKTTKGTVTTPGSVTASVTADQVGDKYNIDLSDFTIPGFKGEPQYDGFFARSKTQMIGGFSGTRPVISSATRATAESSIRASLAKDIVAVASSSVPDGFILYPNAYRIDYISLPDTISGNKITVNEQATLTGFVLKEDDISLALASSVVKNYADEPISVTNLSDLNFSAGTIPLSASSTMAFNLSGTAKFVWTIDAKTFSSQLANKPKSDFAVVLQGYPHVSKASVSFFPFWLGSFPKAESIEVATSTAI